MWLVPLAPSWRLFWRGRSRGHPQGRRPLTECRGRLLPLPLEKMKRGGPGGRCLTSAWLLHRGSHPHPSPLPQWRGRKIGASQEEFDPGQSRVVAGVGARKTPQRIWPKTPESASPLGEGEEGAAGGGEEQPKSSEVAASSAWVLGVAATLTLPSPSRARVRRDPRGWDAQGRWCCVTRVARRIPHCIPARTPEAASTLGEGEEGSWPRGEDPSPPDGVRGRLCLSPGKGRRVATPTRAEMRIAKVSHGVEMGTSRSSSRQAA